MIVVLRSEWYTYLPPPGWAGPDLPPVHLRRKLYAGRVHSTVCFNPDDGELPADRMSYCGKMLTELAVKQRYEREGITQPVTHQIHTDYVATYQQPGDPVYIYGQEDIEL